MAKHFTREDLIEMAKEIKIPTTGVELIAYERERQITEEGYDAEHDKNHAFELISAARSYLSVAEYSRTVKPPPYPPMSWPWDDKSWKPTGDTRRDLVKAAALIAAAIDALPES